MSSSQTSIAVSYLGTPGTLLVSGDLTYQQTINAITAQLVQPAANFIIPLNSSGVAPTLVLVGSDAAQTFFTASSPYTLFQATSTNVSEQSSSFVGTRAGPFSLLIVQPMTLEILASDPSDGSVDSLFWIPNANEQKAGATVSIGTILTEASGHLNSLTSNLFPAPSPFHIIDTVLTAILAVEQNIISNSLTIDSANQTKLNAFLNGSGPTTTLPSISVSVSRTLLGIPIAQNGVITSAVGAVGGVFGVGASVWLANFLKGL